MNISKNILNLLPIKENYIINNLSKMKLITYFITFTIVFNYSLEGLINRHKSKVFNI